MKNKIRVAKEFSFDAAHQLPHHRGLCKNLHGHTYKMLVEMSGEINEWGMILDFGDLKKAIEKYVIKKLDHSYLNDHFSNPTAENMVVCLSETLNAVLSVQFVGITLERVRIWETPTSYAEWRRCDG